MNHDRDILQHIGGTPLVPLSRIGRGLRIGITSLMTGASSVVVSSEELPDEQAEPATATMRHPEILVMVTVLMETSR